jgi:tRNA A37 threonylcarbamoyladenosine dehydratase
MIISIRERLLTFYSQHSAQHKSWKPLFYRLQNPKEREDFCEVLNIPGLMITDSLLDQVKELVKINHPTVKLSTQEQELAAREHIKPYSLEEYGVWVYYPWSNRLVHIVDEKEFIALRTSRNQYKITKEEQALLAQKKIGIVGLSVGQSVSVTMAMERIGGELRLADFDELELTNLNRIRTGIHNLGLLKVHLVAREIAEIDPFITVKCFSEGLSEDNMDAFFTEGGKLDLLVEESDGFDIKILSRYKAKALHIPVIMEASDRCAVDVERFDLEPQRSILHGMVDHLDVNILKTLKTTEDKIPYLLDMVGLSTASLRLKASMLEIDQTITTWPQLSSSVTMGGGITADVSRRMLLNHFTDSGRYHVDIEELIGNKKHKSAHTNIIPYPQGKELTPADMQELIHQISDHLPSAILDTELDQIIEAAIHAPSAGNNQPWKWVSKNEILYLFHDETKSESWSDHKNLISNISFGGALENIILKAEELGYLATYTLFPIPEESKLVASIYFSKQVAVSKTDLSHYIGVRHTNRKKGLQTAVDLSTLPLLKEVASFIENCQVNITTDKKAIDTIAEIVGTSERIRFLNPQAHYDFFKNEIRWRDQSNRPITDGLDIKTLELSLSQEVGLQVASNAEVIGLINEWHKGEGFKKLSHDAVQSSGAVGIVTMPEFNSTNWIKAGQAIQRLWLMASKLELAFQPISAPLFLYAQLKHGGEKNISPDNRIELISLHERLTTIFPELKTEEGVFLFRLSKAEKPTARSLRRPANEIYFKL